MSLYFASPKRTNKIHSIETAFYDNPHCRKVPDPKKINLSPSPPLATFCGSPVSSRLERRPVPWCIVTGRLQSPALTEGDSSCDPHTSSHSGYFHALFSLC